MVIVSNKICAEDGLAASGANKVHLASEKVKGVHESIPSFTFVRKLSEAEPMPEASPFVPALAPSSPPPPLELDGYEFPNWEQDTAKKSTTFYSSGRAEKAFKVMDGTPSKAVSVYSSGRAEKACEFMSEFDLEQFDIFAEVTKPLSMIFPEDEEFTPKPSVPAQPIKVMARPAVFSSRRAEIGCNFPRTEPLVPTHIYSSARAEMACMPLAPFVEDQPEKRVYKALNVYSSGRAERSFKVMTDTPSKAVNVYSSGRAEKAFKVMTDTPSKPVSVYSSGRAEKAFKVIDGTPSKPVSVFNSRLAEGYTLPAFVDDQLQIEVEKSEVTEESEGFSEAFAWLNTKKFDSDTMFDSTKGAQLDTSPRMSEVEPCPELSPCRQRRIPHMIVG